MFVLLELWFLHDEQVRLHVYLQMMLQNVHSDLSSSSSPMVSFEVPDSCTCDDRENVEHTNYFALKKVSPAMELLHEENTNLALSI